MILEVIHFNCANACNIGMLRAIIEHLIIKFFLSFSFSRTQQSIIIIKILIYTGL